MRPPCCEHGPLSRGVRHHAERPGSRISCRSQARTGRKSWWSYEDNFNFLSKMCLTRMREVAYRHSREPPVKREPRCWSMGRMLRTMLWTICRTASARAAWRGGMDAAGNQCSHLISGETQSCSTHFRHRIPAERFLGTRAHAPARSHARSGPSALPCTRSHRH